MNESHLVGSWKLRSYELRGSDGSVERPFGEAPEGRLMYDAAGRMIGQCMDPRRAPFARSNPLRGSDAEVRAAFAGYIAYYGTYTFDAQAGIVTHRVQGSLFPNWVGTELVRHVERQGTRLTLRTPPIRTGAREITGVLVWEREA